MTSRIVFSLLILFPGISCNQSTKPIAGSASGASSYEAVFKGITIYYNSTAETVRKIKDKDSALKGAEELTKEAAEARNLANQLNELGKMSAKDIMRAEKSVDEMNAASDRYAKEFKIFISKINEQGLGLTGGDDLMVLHKGLKDNSNAMEEVMKSINNVMSGK